MDAQDQVKFREEPYAAPCSRAGFFAGPFGDVVVWRSIPRSLAAGIDEITCDVLYYIERNIRRQHFFEKPVRRAKPRSKKRALRLIFYGASVN